MGRVCNGLSPLLKEIVAGSVLVEQTDRPLAKALLGAPEAIFMHRMERGRLRPREQRPAAVTNAFFLVSLVARRNMNVTIGRST